MPISLMEKPFGVPAPTLARVILIQVVLGGVSNGRIGPGRTSLVVVPVAVSTRRTAGSAATGELPDTEIVARDVRGSGEVDAEPLPDRRAVGAAHQRVRRSPSSAAAGPLAGPRRSVAVASEADDEAVTDRTPCHCRVV